MHLPPLFVCKTSHIQLGLTAKPIAKQRRWWPHNASLHQSTRIAHY